MEPYILPIVVIAMLIGIIFLTVRHTQSLPNLRRMLRTKRTQAPFAMNRNTLMRMSLEDKIDPNSQTFQILYELNTTMMRFYEYHPEISARLEHLLSTMKENNAQNPLLAEIPTWTPEIAQLVRETSDAIGNVVIEYSLLWRWHYKRMLAQNPQLRPSMVIRHIRSFREELEREERKSKAEKVLKETQKALNNLSSTQMGQNNHHAFA